MNTVRIEIPTNPTLLLTLAMKIVAKNTELGENSPLKGLDWAANGPRITDAASCDVQAADSRRLAEQYTEKRDAALPDVAEFVRSSRDVLVGLHRSNPRALSDFGFVVNDAVVTKKNGNGNGGTPPPA